MWTRSMTGGPWTRSMKVVHGPLVHDLSSPYQDDINETEEGRQKREEFVRSFFSQSI